VNHLVAQTSDLLPRNRQLARLAAVRQVFYRLADRPSQCGGFGEDLPLKVGAEAAVGENVDALTEQLLEILLQGNDAVRAIVATRERTKHAHVACTVLRRERQDFAAEAPKRFERHDVNDSRRTLFRKSIDGDA